MGMQETDIKCCKMEHKETGRTSSRKAESQNSLGSLYRASFHITSVNINLLLHYFFTSLLLFVTSKRKCPNGISGRNSDRECIGGGKRVREESLESKRQDIHKVPRTVTTPFFAEVASWLQAQYQKSPSITSSNAIRWPALLGFGGVRGLCCGFLRAPVSIMAVANNSS